MKLSRLDKFVIGAWIIFQVFKLGVVKVRFGKTPLVATLKDVTLRDDGNVLTTMRHVEYADGSEQLKFICKIKTFPGRSRLNPVTGEITPLDVKKGE